MKVTEISFIQNLLLMRCFLSLCLLAQKFLLVVVCLCYERRQLPTDIAFHSPLMPVREAKSFSQGYSFFLTSLISFIVVRVVGLGLWVKFLGSGGLADGAGGSVVLSF